MRLNGHALLTLQLRALHLPLPEHEYRFHPKRRWRLDVAFVEEKLAVEIHGATHVGGRHVRGVGFARDREKMNAAVEMGWRVLEYTTDQIENGSAVRQIARILKTSPTIGVGDGGYRAEIVQGALVARGPSRKER